MQQKLLSPEEIAAQAGREIPSLRLSDPTSLFSERAARLRQLADGHAMGEYLRFASQVAQAQHDLLAHLPRVQLPSAQAIERSLRHGLPPLGALTHERDAAWHGLLQGLLQRLARQSGAAVRQTIEQLQGQGDAYVEAQASKLLAGTTRGLDVGAAPLIGAALQVYWVRMATALGRQNIRPIGVANLCPCCGSRPTASIARIGAKESGYRYLHCSLCSVEWHLVRIKCAHCASTKGIYYQSIDDGRPGDQHAIKAECCDECGAYLKIMYMDRDPLVEPIADDLATLPLDLLVQETGKRSCGVNLLFIQGGAIE